MKTALWTRVTAGALAVAVTAITAAAQSNNSRVGSAYIPPDAFMTAVMSVSDTMASPAAELYPTEIADAWFKQNVGMLASDVDQIKLVVGTPGPGEPMAGLVATLKADFDISALNPKLVNTQQPMDVDGVSAYPINGPPGMVLHVKDSRTVLLASANYLGSMLRAADAAPAGPLAKMAASVPHSGTLTAVIAIEPVRPMLNGVIQMQSEQIPPPFAEFTKIPDLTDAILVRLNLENPENGVQTVILAGDEAKADELHGIIVNGMKLGQQMFLAEMSNNLDPEDPVAEATAQYMQRISDHYVQIMTPSKDGRRLVIDGALSQGMATPGVLIALLLPAVQSARQAARRMSSSNNMKQIMLAMHNHHSAYKALPKDITAEDGTPLLSWRVKILPFIEQQDLYQQFKLDEPWDSPHNLALLDRMPETYSHPGMATAPSTTVYQRPQGEGLTSATEEIRFRDITDGTSNTIMVVETLAQDAVEWTKPDDISLDDDNPVALLDDGTRQGFNVALADGAVLFMANAIDPEMFKAMLTRNGRETVNPNGFR